MEVVRTLRVDGLAELHLARMGDPRRLVEFVDTLEPGVPKAEKWVLMISTQVGCPVGCSLCDAGALGYGGNLSPEEILEQVRHVLAANPSLDPASHPKLKIHFARMGEPTLNPAVLPALRALRELVPGPGLMPSLSTVAPRTPAAEGFLADLRAVKDELYPGGRFQLQFSLHATDDAARARIVPIRAWGLERIAAYGAAFRRPGDRRVTLNFAPPPGIPLDPEAVAARFSPEHFLVKVTPVNPTRAADRAGHTRAWSEAPEDVAGFARRLESLGFEVILSPSLPVEIAAATSCGQLWSEALRDQARVRARNLERDALAYVRAESLEERAAAWREAVRPRARPAPALREPALLVVDMQEFFLSPRSPAYLPAARAVAGKVARLVDAFRRAGRPVAFTTHAYEDAREAGPMASWWRRFCRAGSPEARVSAALSPRPEEPVFRKTRYSAFTNPELLPWLRRRRASSLVVCGVMTNLCVEYTALDAFGLGFDVRIPLDATAASDEALHLGALKNAAYGFATLQAAEELVGEVLRMVSLDGKTAT